MCHRMRSRKAAFTAGLACKAPSTSTEAIVARASSGVTSSAMLASPNTRMCEGLPGGLRGFQIVPAVVAQAQFDALSGDGLLGCVRMPLDLVADGGADEVGAIGVEPLLHQEIDMARGRHNRG